MMTMVTMRSYVEGVAAKVLLSGEPLAAHGAGEGPLSCVAADVSLHDRSVQSCGNSEDHRSTNSL